MADKIDVHPCNDDTQNYPFCRIKLMVETFRHSTKLTNQTQFKKVPNVVKQISKKTLI